MDSYLSGREQLGEDSREKKPLSLGFPSEALAPLSASDENVEEKEACSEGSSKVSYLMEDGRVRKIVVTCDCGQVTEIDCKYES